MFSSAEMARGNLTGDEKRKVDSALRAFGTEVANKFSRYGLTRGETPFVRPANFITVLAPNGLHLVVDNVPVGGIPDHTYIDKHEHDSPIPLDAIVGEAVREFGYRQPIGVTLPVSALDAEESAVSEILGEVAENVGQQLSEKVRINRLNIPLGFQHLDRFMPGFLQDHPEPEKNVFLMMRFKEGQQYDEIRTVLRENLAIHGLKVLRADDKDYTGDLWETVCLYMLGCKYGIAVFEEIDEREFNPSVALELGFLMAHNIRCLILRDRRMPNLPTDIVGKLYKTFDTYNIRDTVSVDRNEC